MVYCSALNCQNATSGVYKNSTVTFYGFPLQNKPLLKQWIHNMGRDMGTPSKYQRLCSKHFEDSSFVIDPLKIRKNRRLLKEAVPKKFILDDDGNWLVGTPQSLCGGRSTKTRKRIRNPEHSRVPEIFGNAAAHEGKGSEDWQKEFYKKLIKGNYESLTTLGEGCGGTVIKSKLQSDTESVENTELCRSFSGGSQDSSHHISDKGVTSESHQSLATDQANPTGNQKGNSSLEEEEPDKSREILLHQQTPTRERLYLCTECQKTFKFKIGLLKHKQIHTKNNWGSSYICTDCGNNFGCYVDLVHHQRTQMGERPYKCTECETSCAEKPRLTNHLQTPNVYM